ncbi:MAG: hypothetical protein KGI37_00820 [Alphaproteobacteria bacterium]|nr:hypothetical protein [Alphaproteobacteria bacterium]
MNKIPSLIVALLFLSGCTTYVTDLSVVSNKNVDLKTVDLDKAPQIKNVVGDDSRFVFLFIPFGQPTLKGALDDALRKTNGDLMVDASVYRKSWWFLVGQQTIEIQGTVVKTRGN